MTEHTDLGDDVSRVLAGLLPASWRGDPLATMAPQLAVAPAVVPSAFVDHNRVDVGS
jgi:hypothetical protein